MGYFTQGWERAQKHLPNLVLLLLVQSFVGFLPYVGGVLSFFLSPFIMAAVLALVFEKTGTLQGAFEVAKDRYLDFLIAGLLVGLIVIISALIAGVLAFLPMFVAESILITAFAVLVAVVTAILMSIKFAPLNYYLIKGRDAVEAIKGSWRVPFSTSIKVFFYAFFVPSLLLLAVAAVLVSVFLNPFLTGAGTVNLPLFILVSLLGIVVSLVVQAWMWGIYAVVSEKLLGKEGS